MKRMKGPYLIEEDYIEDPINLATKVRKGVFGIEVSESVNIKSTSLLEINLFRKDYDKTEEDLNKLQEAILESHRLKIEEQKEEMDKIASILKKEIQAIEQDIISLTARGQQVAPLYLEINKVQAELEKVEQTALSFSETKIVKGPDVSEKEPSVFTPLFSAVLGLFLGITLAFIKQSRY